jgi:hypothetical protein
MSFYIGSCNLNVNSQRMCPTFKLPKLTIMLFCIIVILFWTYFSMFMPMDSSDFFFMMSQNKTLKNTTKKHKMQKIRWWNVMSCIEYTIHICNKDFGLKMQIDQCENVLQSNSKQPPHFKWRFQLFVWGKWFSFHGNVHS